MSLHTWKRASNPVSLLRDRLEVTVSSEDSLMQEPEHKVTRLEVRNQSEPLCQLPRPQEELVSSSPWRGYAPKPKGQGR